MALRNTFEMPIGHASVKVTIELTDDISGASHAKCMLLARLTSKVADAVAERDERLQSASGCRQAVVKQATAQALPPITVEDVAPRSDDPIVISLKDWTGNLIRYKAKPSTKFIKLAEARAFHLGMELSTGRFIYGGMRVNLDDTLQQCGMEEGDEVEVHTVQAGS